MMRHCVAAYAERVALGYSRIFGVRRQRRTRRHCRNSPHQRLPATSSNSLRVRRMSLCRRTSSGSARLARLHARPAAGRTAESAARWAQLWAPIAAPSARWILPPQSVRPTF